MARPKKEAVSVSFHYLLRTSGEGKNVGKFSPGEFSNLYAALKQRPTVDLGDERAADRLRYRQEVPIENVELVDSRTIFGVFKASYWGHAYDNTARGKIPANSISLRPFYFLIYISESGRLYFGSQYLGHFGGYAGLRATICGLLPEPDDIVAVSFRLDGLGLAKTHAKEVRVAFSSRSQSIASSNVFSQGGMLAFKKKSKDDGFETQVAEKIFPFFGKTPAQVRRGVASILNENALLEVKDEDIDDCTVIANVNGKKKVIYMIETGTFASRFPLDVAMTLDGHPEYQQTKLSMLKLLKDEVIARKENV